MYPWASKFSFPEEESNIFDIIYAIRLRRCPVTHNPLLLSVQWKADKNVTAQDFMQADVEENFWRTSWKHRNATWKIRGQFLLTESFLVTWATHQVLRGSRGFFNNFFSKYFPVFYFCTIAQEIFTHLSSLWICQPIWLFKWLVISTFLNVLFWQQHQALHSSEEKFQSVVVVFHIQLISSVITPRSRMKCQNFTQNCLVPGFSELSEKIHLYFV